MAASQRADPFHKQMGYAVATNIDGSMLVLHLYHGNRFCAKQIQGLSQLFTSEQNAWNRCRREVGK